MKRIFLSLVGVFAFSLIASASSYRDPAANPQFPVPAVPPDAQVVDLLKGYTRIQTDVIEPLDLPGSFLIVTDQGTPTQKEYWSTLIPGTPKATATFKNEVLLESVVNKGFAAKADILGMANLEMSNEDRAQVILEDVYVAQSLPYFDAKVNAAALLMATNLRTSFPKANFYYVQNVKYTTVKHKVFHKTDAKAKLSGYGVGVDGNVYTTNSLFTLRPVVSVNLFPITLAPGVIDPKLQSVPLIRGVQRM